MTGRHRRAGLPSELDWPVNLPLALKFARRELRGGLKRLRIFLGCLALGVGALAAVGSVADAVQAGLAADGRVILGGDVDLRLTNFPATAGETAYLHQSAEVSQVAEMRAMARLPEHDARTLVELKSVDAVYPLAGAVELVPPMTLDNALARKDGVWGAVAEQGVFDRLGVAVGGHIRVGDADFVLRAVIAHEPDRGADAFSLGPRVMISANALPSTDLIAPGSIVDYRYRLKLSDGANLDSFHDALGAKFPDAGWRILDRNNAAPGLKRLIDRTAMYLTLVGLSALLIGGVGIANAVKGYLDSRLSTIATFKCLGASNALVFAIYLAQVAALGLAGTFAGLVIGAAAPFALAKLLGAALPFPVHLAIYPEPLIVAGAFGLVTAIAFSFWPLLSARSVSPAGLFRSRIRAPRAKLQRADIAILGCCGGVLIMLAALAAKDAGVAVGFAAGAILALGILRGAAALLTFAARARFANLRGAAWLRLALANLRRPGADTATVMLSLGLGLVALVAVSTVEGNLAREVGDEMPGEAPAFYFLDIQRDQLQPFLETVRNIPGVHDVQHMPQLRGRITAIKGVPVEKVKVSPEQSWVTQGDRGLTYAAAMPPGTKLAAGSWWPENYSGPPLISFDSKAAEGLGIGIGDNITVNLLGRDIVGKIANLRDIDWSTLGINFVIVFAPGALEDAPQTHLATIRADRADEAAIEKAVTDRFPNISAIRVRDALQAVNTILSRLGAAVRLVAFVTLAAGILALAGTVAARHERRVYEAVVLKVLGARRRDLIKAYLAEYGLVGLATALLAVVIGVPAGAVVLTGLMHMDFVFLPGAAALAAAVGLAVCLAFGFAGTWAALGHRASEHLRNE